VTSSSNPCPGKLAAFPGAQSTLPNDVIASMQCGQFPSGSLNASHDVWQCLHDFVCRITTKTEVVIDR